MQGLVERCPPLDNNSRYCYLLLCEHFAATCAVAETAGEISAFVTAYIPPERPDTLFVWQVAVDASLRGQGVAKRLVQHVLQQPACATVRFLEATVNPSNNASRALFQSFASSWHTSLHEACVFPETLFPANHEQENLIRVGPLSHHERPSK